MYLSVIIVVVLFSRLLPQFLFRNLITNVSDFWNLLITAEAIKKNKHRVPERVDNFLIDDRLDYPPLIPWFFSFLPRDISINISRYLPALSDFIFIIAFWLFCSLSIPEIGLPLNPVTKFWVVLIFTTHPLYFYSGKGPRTFQFSPRIVSEMLVGTMFLTLFIWLSTHSTSALVMAITLGVLQTITNRFGLQVIIILSIGLSIVMSDIQISLLPFIIIVAAFLIFGRTWGRVLTGSIGHGIFMRRLWYNPRRLKQQRFNKKPTHSVTIRSFLRSLIDNNPLALGLLLSPGIFATAYLFYYSSVNGVQFSPLISFSMDVTAIVFVVSLLFSLRALKFWGTGERYLYYGITFQSINLVTAAELSEFPVLIYGSTISLSLLFFGLSMIILTKANTLNSDDATDEKALYSWLNKTGDKLNILPIWGGRANKLVIYTGCKIPDIQYSYRPWLISIEDITNVYVEYGYPHPGRLLQTMDNYDINYIVLRKSILKSATNLGLTYNFEEFNLVFDNSGYSVYASPERM